MAVIQLSCTYYHYTLIEHALPLLWSQQMVHRPFQDLKFTLDHDSGYYGIPRASPGGDMFETYDGSKHRPTFLVFFTAKDDMPFFPWLQLIPYLDSSSLRVALSLFE